MLRQAANSISGLELDPMNGLIDNLTNLLLKEYPHVDDLEVVALVRHAINAGIDLANSRVGELR
jgi:hypothetical protein